MNIHKKIQDLFYEYLRQELRESDRVSVEQHISSCEECRVELESMKETLAMIPSAALDPSKQRSEEYWQSFIVGIERKIAEKKPLRRRSLLSFGDMLDHFFFTPRPYVTAFGGALAVMICIVVLWRWYDHREMEERNMAAKTAAESVQIDSTSEQVYQYVRQSKILLVGLTNMRPVQGASYDLSIEQEKSRELIHQARYLKSRPLDNRTEQLIDDLQKILIELANMKAEGNAPNIEIIRGGVHQENLLFKIRMAEETYNVNQENRNSF